MRVFTGKGYCEPELWGKAVGLVSLQTSLFLSQILQALSWVDSNYVLLASCSLGFEIHNLGPPQSDQPPRHNYGALEALLNIYKSIEGIVNFSVVSLHRV